MPIARYSYEHKCKQCGVHFYSHHKDAKYCSNECKGIWMSSRVKITCAGCGKIFEIIPSKSFQKYCTRECYMNSHKKREEHRLAKADLVLTLANLLKIGYEIKTCGQCNRVLASEYENELCPYCDNEFKRIEARENKPLDKTLKVD